MLVTMTNPCKFGENPFTSPRNIMVKQAELSFLHATLNIDLSIILPSTIKIFLMVEELYYALEMRC